MTSLLWKWWTAIAGTSLIVGGVAWILKLWVVVATDGRVVATGAAGAFFDIGFYSLLVGSTGLGLRLTKNEHPVTRIAAAVGSPFAFVLSFFAFDLVGRAVLGVAVPSYLLGEAGIFISAVVWLAIGFASMFLQAFPDLHFAIEDQIAEGDKVVTRWMSSATHQGELMGVAPTGNRTGVSGVTISRISDGKLAEDWNNWDTLGLMRQIGAIP